MKKSKTMIAVFVTPALITFLVAFVYPVLRTVMMSFFKVETITQDSGEWSFTGFGNYINIWTDSSFRGSMFNILILWLVGGAVVLGIALLFAVILTSGVRFKSFWRAVIYLPNVVSAVALATMWVQFVFNQRYGLLAGFTKTNWLSSDMKFWAMLIAFSFGAVGYYMLIFLSGIERIPQDLYEAATIDGAKKVKQFTHITIPLLKGVFKTNLTFWSVNMLMFFVWSQMFSPVSTEASTMTPVVYLYDKVFGTQGSANRDAGRGAAVGVTLAVFMIVIYILTNKLVKEEDVEF